MLRDVLKEAGEKVFLLGNEAIARGALEAGIDVYAAYPGTPSSEIGVTLQQACDYIRDRMEYYMEWSINEKVAFEVAIGASLAGKRGMCGMKHVGVNVAADALFSFSYIGARGGFVCVTADDPFMHSSQNEQDNRWYGKAAKVPVIEPSTVQEAKDYVKLAFEISEKFNAPVLFRTVTRLNHGSGVVELGEIPEKKLEKVEWEKHPETDVIVPAVARRLKPRVIERLKRLEEHFSKAKEFNWVEGGDGKAGVIASGLSYVYAKEAIKRLGRDLPLLKLSTTHPLPTKLIEDFVSNLDKVAVVEELDPFVELHVKAIAKDYGVEVYGKENGYFPMNYEYSVGVVEEGIAKMLGISPTVNVQEKMEALQKTMSVAPPRPPVLCPGCPHAASFYAIKKVAGNECLPSDIGCYTLGVNKPFQTVDITICMGASVGVPNGLYRVINNKIVVTAGDSTFFHATIPALANAVYNGAKFVYVVLDNLTTAMTGHQPHPGVSESICGVEKKKILIEDVVKGVGVDFVEVVNPMNLKKMEETLRRALEHDGVAVIVARQPCAILWTRERRRKGVKIRPFEVTEACTLCLRCVSDFTCPAIVYDGEKVWIDEALCVGCGVCRQVCPENAIRVKRTQ